MKKRSSAFARIFAVIALALAVAVVIVAITSSLGGSDDSSKSGRNQPAKKQRPKTKAKTYVVKDGDTLVEIGRQTGVPVAVLLRLNPEVDPQLLIAGETLKLR
jgi:LysM repeat protein